VQADEDKEAITSNIIELTNELSEAICCNPKQITHSKAGYLFYTRLPLFSEFNYQSRNEETPHLVIKCAPVHGDRKFIAIEFKGHPYKNEHWYCALLWIIEIFGRRLLKQYWDKLIISHIDLAVGLDFPLNEVLFDKLWGQKAAVFYNNAGAHETIYLQPKNPKLEVAIYDRKAKMRNRRINKVAVENTRIEIRLGKLNWQFSELLSSPESTIKPFKMLKLYNFSKIKKSKQFNNDQLLALKVMGILPYLRTFNKYRRDTKRLDLKKHLIPILNIKLIEDLWLSELKRMSKLIPFRKYSSPVPKSLRAKFITEYFNE